jgi:hypothetical protein
MHIYHLAWEHARKDVMHVIKKNFNENCYSVMDFLITGNLTYVESIRKNIILEIDRLIEKAEYIITYNDNKHDCVYWREYVSEIYTLTRREIPDYLKP